MNLRLAVPLIFAFALAACLQNIPGRVADGPNGTVTGSYYGKSGFLSGVGTAPGRTGGACLVFRQVTGGQVCRRVCPLTKLAMKEGAGFMDPKVHRTFDVVGYCIKEPDGAAEGTCWYKPPLDTNHCAKGTNLQDKDYPLGPVEARPLGNGRPVIWRVLSCQNIKVGGCQLSPGVQGQDRQYRYGTKFSPL